MFLFIVSIGLPSLPDSSTTCLSKPSIFALPIVAETAAAKDIYCEISLEERMACGVKACVGCSIKTLDGMKKVCHDGPVFNGKTIVDVTPQENDSCSCN